ncbi:DUF2637 domain-containing protein [Streptomyces sp. DH12]|uniref:DUF2637 domain-containing protein n=1 Tax=Streptomyces sp. DH12 TaxID=2857010 RepID=UPI001E2DC704|nr:DUF2637 domain-containing protein [Streptomyces sp. DH12]
MNRIVWWASLALIGAAAAGMAAWSLYVVAHDIYDVPEQLAYLVAAVFDGAALACLYLASTATAEDRSAAGPRVAVLGLAGISVILNAKHADHIDGGVVALLLFAAPTVALLIVADLAWAATRARRRAAAGERAVTLPRYGAWGWILASEQAWKATKARAVAHVTSTDPVRTESGPRPDRPRSATAALRDHFTDMDPVDAIRFAHSAKPNTPPAELAAELTSYGVPVSAVQVALVLGHEPPQVRIERPGPSPAPAPAAPLTSPDRDPDPIRTPANVLDATRLAVGRGFYDEVDVHREVTRMMGRPVRLETVRRYLDGKAKPPEQPPLPEPPAGDGVGRGGGGYN